MELFKEEAIVGKWTPELGDLIVAFKGKVSWAKSAERHYELEESAIVRNALRRTSGNSIVGLLVDKSHASTARQTPLGPIS